MSPVPSHAEVILVKVVQIQAQLIMGLAIYTVLLLKVRQHFQRYRKRESEKFSEFIIDELCKTAEERTPLVEARIFANRFEKSIIQETLLFQIKMVSGPERDLLRSYYEIYKFREEDVVRTESHRWWIRLKALTNLGNLQRDELAPLFNVHMQDDHPMVSIAATLSLSSLNHVLNGPDFFDRLPPAVLGRRDVLFGIVMNSAAIHGTEILGTPIHQGRDSRLAESCVRALAEIKDSASIALLMEKIGPHLSEDLIFEIIGALSSCGDPEVLPHVRPFLKHEAPKIRAAAARCCLIFEDPEVESTLISLLFDPSVEVRRVIQLSNLVEKKAA